MTNNNMTINKEKFYELVCVKCGKIWDETQTASTCLACGGSLEAEYDWEFIKSRLNFYSLKNAPISAAKYLNFYPIMDATKIISLNEGGTPLKKSRKIAKKLGLNNLYFKDETSNPTGGFKDRGTMVEITKALEMGSKAVVVASTGNMAASVAAYASQANLPAYIVVPEGTPLGKLAQTLAYGARMIQVRASYSECAKLAEKIADKYNFYLSGDYVFRQEGQKSQGYEIVEQLFWRSPDYIIAPIGVGTNISAIYKGIKEYYNLGLIDKLPKVIGVQAKGANAVAQAFEKKKKDIEILDKVSTVSSAVAVNNPFDGIKVLNYVYESNGMVIDVTDEETLEAEKEMANEESIFAEPSAALPLAGLKKLMKDKIIKPDEKVVCVVTGNGLKDPITMLKILPSPPSIEPKMEEIDNYLEMKLYNIQASSEKDKVETIWETEPDKEKLLDIIKDHFKITLTERYLKMVQEEVNKFFKKGKKMVKSDLQHIIEDILKTMPDSEKILKIKDFKVTTSKNDKAKASIEVCINGSACCSDEAEGVGPVDAVMKCTRNVIKKEGLMKYWLTNYDVKIDQKGTDATVEVTMEIKDDEDTKVIATATSPDVIVASVEAFERGYNILYNKRNNK